MESAVLRCMIIFDMDDTLFATASLWKRAENHLLESLGSTWSVELALHYKGMNALDVAATIHRLLQPEVSVEHCQNVLRNALIDAFAADMPEPMRGAIGCVHRMAEITPLALASGSPLSVIESVLTHHGVRPEFQCLISSESVPNGKPAPDVFLAAAAVLEVAPEQCLVFEDSLVGVCAAKAAGMRCVAVPSSHPTEIAEIADRVFSSLDEVDLHGLL